MCEVMEEDRSQRMICARLKEMAQGGGAEGAEGVCVGRDMVS